MLLDDLCDGRRRGGIRFGPVRAPAPAGVGGLVGSGVEESEPQGTSAEASATQSRRRCADSTVWAHDDGRYRRTNPVEHGADVLTWAGCVYHLFKKSPDLP